jgi:protein TonB
MNQNRFQLFIRRTIHRVTVVIGGLFAAFALFMVLPLLESITKTPPADTVIRTVDTGKLPEPPPPMEEEKPPEEPPPAEEEPPKLADEAPPLDLAQMELALNIGVGGGLGGDFAVRLPVGAQAGGARGDAATEELFSLSDLDQKPRAIYQPSPTMSAQIRKRAPGLVNVIFVVDERGRVLDPSVQSSTDPVFNAAALSAVKQWKFEPGKRNGQPVRSRMRVPITFPKGQS